MKVLLTLFAARLTLMAVVGTALFTTRPITGLNHESAAVLTIAGSAFMAALFARDLYEELTLRLLNRSFRKATAPHEPWEWDDED